MRNKPRVVIVSSYGNPLAINVWLKYFFKFWHDVVDEVYIVAGGNRNYLLDTVIDSNTKLCEYYNQKLNSNKCHFIYKHDELDGGCVTVSTHAHLLYNGTKEVAKKHNDATLLYIDDDIYVKDKNIIEEYFNKVETNVCAYAGQICNREQFDEKTHILGWFVFCDLRTTMWLNEQYNLAIKDHYKNIDTKTDYIVRDNYYRCKSEIGNMFGAMRYFGPLEFKFCNYTRNYEQVDEVFWLFSKFLRLHYGVDKELVIPNDIWAMIYFHTHIPFEDQVDQYKNKKMYHISGNYQQHHFLYSNFYQDYELLDQMNIIENHNIKLLLLLHLCLKCWDLHNIVDDGGIYTNIKNYLDHVYLLSGLPELLSKKNVDRLSELILEDL